MDYILDRIIDMIIRHVSPFCTGWWKSVLLWRSMALLQLLLIVIAYSQRDKILALPQASARREHDTRLFEQCDEILTERRLLDMLDQLTGDHSHCNSQFLSILDFVRFFDESGNQFANHRIREAAVGLVASLNHLYTFMATHFFPWPDKQATDCDIRFCLYPHWNIDRGGSGWDEESDHYDEEAEKLVSHVLDTRAKYSTYRLAVKKALHI